MAIIQALLGLVSRSVGRITSAIFGWAVVALFGQTSGREKIALSALVGAAAAWPILLIGVAVPKTAAFVLAFVPLPEWLPSWTVRVVWIGLAAAVPLAVGVTLAVRRPSAPAGRDSALKRLLRGVPITVGISAAFLVVFVTVPVLRLGSIIRRRIDVHVPLVTDARGYDVVAAEIAATLDEHGFEVREATPGWWMTLPSRILLRLGGPAFQAYVPARLAYYRGPRLEVALYPSALLLRGPEQDTAWAHGIVVEALTDAPAFQTFDPGAQSIEQQIRRVWTVYEENPAAHQGSTVLLGRLGEITEEIGRLPVPYDEWQVVYRQALQLGRALRGDRQLLEAVKPGHQRRVDDSAEEGAMTMERDGQVPRGLSNRALLGEITAKASLLVKKEIELAKAEIRADLRSELAMGKALAIAFVTALTGVNLLLVAGVLALATLMPGWMAALIVGGSLLVIGAVVGWIGWSRRVTAPLAVTRRTLKEDMQWAKERVA
jgi:Putative Actinobacterial Holin-X, holin superfamily III